MVRKLQLMFIMAGILGLTLSGAFSASAATNNGGSEPDEVALEGAEPGLVTALPAATTGTHARLVAIVRGATVYRAAGVSLVTHPATGIYCIKPKGTWDVTKVVPMVGLEWGHSSGFALLAWYEDSAPQCPAKNIEVTTYDFSSGTSVPSDNVAFTIVVP